MLVVPGLGTNQSNQSRIAETHARSLPTSTARVPAPSHSLVHRVMRDDCPARHRAVHRSIMLSGWHVQASRSPRPCTSDHRSSRFMCARSGLSEATASASRHAARARTPRDRSRRGPRGNTRIVPSAAPARQRPTRARPLLHIPRLIGAACDRRTVRTRRGPWTISISRRRFRRCCRPRGSSSRASPRSPRAPTAAPASTSPACAAARTPSSSPRWCAPGGAPVVAVTADVRRRARPRQGRPVPPRPGGGTTRRTTTR